MKPNLAPQTPSFSPVFRPWGYWFSGLVDGEGCFSISRVNKGGYRCAFILQLRLDDHVEPVAVRSGGADK